MSFASRVGAWVFLSILGTAGICACTLLVDSSDLAGARDEPGSGDASPDGTSLADAAFTDAALTEDGPTNDAADGSVFSCSALGTAPLFCDDFDTSLLSAKWSKVDADGYTLTLDTQKFVSAPRSVHLAIDFDGGTGTAAQSLDKTLPQAYSALTIAFDVMIETGDYWFRPLTVQGMIDGSDVSSSIVLILADGQFVFRDEAYDYTQGKTVAYSTDPFPAKAANGWVHFEMGVKLTQPATVTIKEDGELVFERPLHAFWRKLPPTVAFGHYYRTSDESPTSVRLDNVVVHGEP